MAISDRQYRAIKKTQCKDINNASNLVQNHIQFFIID